MWKVLDSMWFPNGEATFGIILAEDQTTGERTLYAGAADGFDRQADEQTILSWGNKVNLEMLEGLIGQSQSGINNQGILLLGTLQKGEGTTILVGSGQKFITYDLGVDAAPSNHRYYPRTMSGLGRAIKAILPPFETSEDSDV